MATAVLFSGRTRQRRARRGGSTERAGASDLCELRASRGKRRSWQAVERLLATAPFAALAPLARLTFPARDLYPATHWALTGTPAGFDTPDEDVYLTGRNVMLLSKAAIHCAQPDRPSDRDGPLATIPFPMRRRSSSRHARRTLSLGLDHDIEIDAPFASLHKNDVMTLGLSSGCRWS